ncbi:MAG: NAD-dependent epimerase/dehydratase family protein [Acidimicrobiia bacterium]
MDATVLVTGGAGFIGSYLCHQLADRGYRIRILDNLRRANLPAIQRLLDDGRAELIDGDIRYQRVVADAMQGVDLVAHLAATSINRSQAAPAESVDIDIRGSEHVFSAAADAGVRRVVFASSASVYGQPERLPMTEDDPLRPQTPYCLGKLAGEHLLQFYGRARGLEWNILRFFNVYGPGQHNDAYYTAVASIFLERLLDGQPPIVDGSGEQTMDLVHVADVARALVHALEAESSGNVCNVGTGIETSVAELARLLVESVGVDIEPQFRPRPVIVTRRVANIRRAAERLGWEPGIGVKEGVEDIVRAARAGAER